MRLFGHPLHPMLVHMPISLWVLASLCDGATLIGIGGAWPLGWLCLVGGLATALPAMAAGFLDFARLEDAAAPTATRHMMLMASAWAVYGAALVLRSDGMAVAATPSLPAMGVGLVGLALLIAGAAHGGKLVYGLGVGIDRPDP